jgi:hypothetical protein
MHYPKIDVCPAVLLPLIERGLIREQKRRLTLTAPGRFVAAAIRRARRIVTRIVTVNFGEVRDRHKDKE